MQCSGKTYDGWHYHSCSRNATVERGGKWYCPSHDPEAIKKRQEKSRAKYEEKLCPKCHWELKIHWTYCPNCGTKNTTYKE